VVRGRGDGARAAEGAALRDELAALKAAAVRPAAPPRPAAPGRANARKRAAAEAKRAPAKRAPRKEAPRGRKNARGGERAVAAVAAGNFASRIARFANASLGAGAPKAARKARAPQHAKKR
jgi:hypothetical protein